MRHLRVGLGLALLTLAAALAETQTAPSGPLDGTVWSVKVTPDAAGKGEKAFDDVLVFRDGRVAMSECLKWGFKASKYTAESSDGGWSFKTTQTSEKEGESVWTAGIKGDALDGRMVWTKKDGTVLSYTFAGRKAGT